MKKRESKQKITAPKTYDPGKGHPKEHLAYLNWQEMQTLMRLNNSSTPARGPKGLPSFRLDDSYGSAPASRTTSSTSSTTTKSTSTNTGTGMRGAGSNYGAGSAGPNTTSSGPSYSGGTGYKGSDTSGTRGAGSNYGAGSARPGTTSGGYSSGTGNKGSNTGSYGSTAGRIGAAASVTRSGPAYAGSNISKDTAVRAAAEARNAASAARVNAFAGDASKGGIKSISVGPMGTPVSIGGGQIKGAISRVASTVPSRGREAPSIARDTVAVARTGPAAGQSRASYDSWRAAAGQRAMDFSAERRAADAVAKVARGSGQYTTSAFGTPRGGLYEADLNKSFGQNWADNTLTGRAVMGGLDAMGVTDPSLNRYDGPIRADGAPPYAARGPVSPTRAAETPPYATPRQAYAAAGPNVGSYTVDPNAPRLGDVVSRYATDAMNGIRSLGQYAADAYNNAFSGYPGGVNPAATDEGFARIAGKIKDNVGTFGYSASEPDMVTGDVGIVNFSNPAEYSLDDTSRIFGDTAYKAPSLEKYGNLGASLNERFAARISPPPGKLFDDRVPSENGYGLTRDIPVGPGEKVLGFENVDFDKLDAMERRIAAIRRDPTAKTLDQIRAAKAALELTSSGRPAPRLEDVPDVGEEVRRKQIYDRVPQEDAITNLRSNQQIAGTGAMPSSAADVDLTQSAYDNAFNSLKQTIGTSSVPVGSLYKQKIAELRALYDRTKPQTEAPEEQSRSLNPAQEAAGPFQDQSVTDAQIASNKKYRDRTSAAQKGLRFAGNAIFPGLGTVLGGGLGIMARRTEKLVEAYRTATPEQKAAIEKQHPEVLAHAVDMGIPTISDDPIGDYRAWAEKAGLSSTPDRRGGGDPQIEQPYVPYTTTSPIATDTTTGTGGSNTGGTAAGRPYQYYLWDVGVGIPAEGDPKYNEYLKYLSERMNVDTV